MAETQRLEIVFTNPLRIIEELAPEGRQFVTVALGTFKVTTEGSLIMFTLPVDMQVQMKVAYTDSHGNAASIDGDVSWASSDPAIATATVDTMDSTICTVAAAGGVGQVQVTATCDADLGAGVRELVTLADITVVAGEAVAGVISPVGEATPIA